MVTWNVAYWRFFTAVSTPKLREAVLKKFCKPDAKLRVPQLPLGWA